MAAKARGGPERGGCLGSGLREEAMNSFICLLAQVATSFCKHFRLHATFFFFFVVHPKTAKLKKGEAKEKGLGKGEGVVRGRVLCGGHCGCVRQPTSYISLYTQTTAEGPKLATATLFLFL